MIQDSTRNRFVAVVLMIPLIYLAVAASQRCWQDIAFTRLETEISFWGRGDYTPTSARREWVDRQLERLLRSSSAHPEYQGLRAAQLAWEDYWVGAAHDQLRRQSLQAALYAQALRPAHRQGWQRVLQYSGGGAVYREAKGLATERLQLLEKRL